MTLNKLGISVVICTYNGRARLQPTLASILRQDLYESSFELIVVDNASQDKTFEFCMQFLSAGQVGFSWKIVTEENPGLNYARLRGLRESNFEIVLFCDDDNTFQDDYLKTGFEIMNDAPAIGALGGCGFPSFEGNKPEWFDRYSHSFAVGPQSSGDGKVLKYPAELYGAGTFFRKSTLLNFFDQGFKAIMSDRKGNTLASGGDVEWCYLVQLAGYEIWYSHTLKFTHIMPESRMQWSYYLRLKEGIASGTASLLPYVCLLKNRKTSPLAYCLRCFSKSAVSTLVYIKFKIRTLSTSKPMRPEMELTARVLHAKMSSYWRNGIRAYQHFRHLKTML